MTSANKHNGGGKEQRRLMQIRERERDTEREREISCAQNVIKLHAENIKAMTVQRREKFFLTTKARQQFPRVLIHEKTFNGIM